MSGPRQVVVGVSGSPASIRALRYAADHARRDHALLVPVHAWLPPGGDLADRRAPSAELRRAWRQAASRRLANAIEAAWGPGPVGIRVEPVIERGQAGPALLETADSTDDLLVIGAGRRGRLTRLWRCRVSRYCHARAVCPVVVVPPPHLGARARSLRHRPLTADEVLRRSSDPRLRSR